jgi:hypothetical protein
MTKIEALELELAARKMVEGTELVWRKVLRHKLDHTWISSGKRFEDCSFTYIELALGIVEGKPVWEGDTLYDSETGAVTLSFDCGHPCRGDGKNIGWAWERLSWNPPKPKTVMVELPYDWVKFMATEVTGIGGGVKVACRKALVGVK